MALTATECVELRIRDERQDMPGVIVPLAELLRQLEAQSPGVLEGGWRTTGACRGYGEHVLRLESAGSVEFLGGELFPFLLSDREYVEHGGFRPVRREDIEIGVWDSAFLYLRSTRPLALKVAAQFVDTEIIACRET